MPDLHLTPLDPTYPDALALMAQSEALMRALYPSESNHFEPPEGLPAVVAPLAPAVPPLALPALPACA